MNRQSRDTTVQRSGRATNNGACTGDAVVTMMKDAVPMLTMMTMVG
jgi:hypothetical protein